MPDISELDWFEYREAEYNLWCKVMKANQKGKSSLDHRVRDHADARQLIQDLLDGLCESLEDLLRLARLKPSIIAECAFKRQDGETTDEASSSSGDSEDDSEIELHQDDIHRREIEYHMFYIKATISQLVNLSTRIRQSGVKYRYQKADESLKEGDFDDYVQSWRSSILGGKLAKATATVPYQTGAIADFLHESRLTIVQRRLIRANLLRRNRIRFVRESHMNREEPIAETEATFEPQSTNQEILDCEPDVVSQALPDENIPCQTSPKVVPSVVPSMSHTATEIGSQFDLSVFLKEKSPSVATRATRIGGRDDLEYPKCPKPPTIGTPLACPYCADLVDDDHILWHVHEFALKCFPWEDTNEEDDDDQSMIDIDLELVRERTEDLVNFSPEDGNASFLEEPARHSDGSDSDVTHLQPGKGTRQAEISSESTIPSTDPELFEFYYRVCSPTGAGVIPPSPGGRRPPSPLDLGQENHLESEIGAATDIRISSGSYSGQNAVPTSPNTSSFSEVALWDGHSLDGCPSSLSSLLVESGDQEDLGKPKVPLFNSSRKFSPMKSDNTKTNMVRTVGACMRCRIQKVTCTAEGVCDRCVKAHPKEPQSSCFREDLIVIANSLTQQRFAGLDRVKDIEVKELLRTARPQYLEPIFKGAVVFTRGWPQFRLPTTLRNYQCLDDMSRQVHSGCVLSREHGGVPSYQDLVKWAEQMILPEDRGTFEGSIEHFIKMYSAPQRSRSYVRRPQMELLDKVHTMKCMYKICCQDDFVFIRDDTGAVKYLPLPAKAELRAIARMALETAERDILKALDKLKAAATKVPEQDLPALWATLWQLIFIYRDLLRNRTPRDNDAGALLNAVAVFYAAHFRTLASLGKLSMDSLQRHWGPGETQQAQLSGAFDHALSLRDTLQWRLDRTIAAGIDEIDHRLKALVVDPEMKVLGRRTNKKTSGGK
ncbi:hypothetical protein CPAR01_14535 [Colletotrichum paranaense]|uniref:Zn(2)-C6 fungal-type domain-containing protein n=1 Tax=Colletotrichum paranaense TaxID=1914294 RepID=A0ABQ9S1B7_9PEZI|nr:uncharacterized protein CPAR01_14535 [Colletotrichum paranaense]KAK1521618.1 hypothetical protein CPAR01_14535 [Colletotrichum paranaense]